LGCGTGTNVITLAQAGWQATGVDFASRAIAIGRRKLRAANVQAELHVGDVTHLPNIKEPFDLALDMGCFHGVEDRAAYLAELTRLLAPGGFWLMYRIFRPAAPPRSTPGLVEADLELNHTQMTPVWRRDGFDRRERPSAWFLYQNRKNQLSH
jgi:ubiquinone/menaquinone biosynthesis C-methylase UbiE